MLQSSLVVLFWLTLAEEDCSWAPEQILAATFPSMVLCQVSIHTATIPALLLEVREETLTSVYQKNQSETAAKLF